jgi:hypothetical protein
MDDNAKTTGCSVVQLHTTASPRQESPPELHGSLLVFTDKQYFVGSGGYRTEMPLGERFVVMAAHALWKRWQGKKVVERVGEINGHYPKRHELGYSDERLWDIGPGDRASDPWQDSREVALIRETDFVEFVFCTATAGGRDAVDSLGRSIRNARVLSPGQQPIIELAWAPMRTRYGMKSKPDLKIVGWWKPPETTAIAPRTSPAA